MNRILHILNGDLNLQLLKKADIDGDFIMWGDFLYSGEVRKGISLEELSRIRAEYIASIRLGEFEDVYQEFKGRNRDLISFRKYKKIYLWFERDIYDQLQLIQILDWFAKYCSSSVQIYYIDIKEPLVKLSKFEISNYLIYKEPITPEHYIVAKRAWSAFTSNTPYPWYRLLFYNLNVFPNFKGTIKRVLEEYPNIKNGLNRTEYQALSAVSNGNIKLKDIYLEAQSMEENPFMGENIFLYTLKHLTKLNLLEYIDIKDKFKITPFGKRILDSRDFLYRHKKIDRWIGGVHLTNIKLWCWDTDSSSIVEY